MDDNPLTWRTRFCGVHRENGELQSSISRRVCVEIDKDKTAGDEEVGLSMFILVPNSDRRSGDAVNRQGPSLAPKLGSSKEQNVSHFDGRNPSQMGMPAQFRPTTDSRRGVASGGTGSKVYPT
jgi:hypothetical protein